MRTNSFACLCAVAGLALAGCPDPEVVANDTNVAFPDTGARVDARGDAGPADSGARDSGARDTGAMLDTGVAEDAFAESDAGVDAFMMATEDAFGLDAFALDAFAPDAFTAMDAGRDAFVGSDAGRDAFIGPDAGRDAFAADANRDAFIGPDAFHGDAFLPACAVATHLVINEIDYDQPGSDTAEFVEIYNPTAAAVDLSTYTLALINGAMGGMPPLQREYGRITLNGMIPAGGYVVLTAPAPAGMPHVVVVPASARRIEMPGALTDRLQNGGNSMSPAPDGVVLFNGTTIVDAAIYEGTIMSFVPSSGSSPVTTVSESGSIGEETAAESLSRRPNGCDRDMPMMDWYITALTPGAANP